MTPRHLHFMGIGGIGMSGLAAISLARGWRISGCDMKVGASARKLQEQGAAISIGHSPIHLDAAVDTLVYSSAVRDDEPELVEARARGVETIGRGKLLAELAGGHRLFGVAGAHGKTTTSGMAAQLLLAAGWDPTIAVGGIMRALGSNAHAGTGRWFVAETDESDGSFLHLWPEVAIVTNIDREHLNHYRTMEHVIEAFQTFVHKIPADGVFIRCADDPLTRSLQCRATRQLTYGIDTEADLMADAIRLEGQGSRFTVGFKGCDLGEFQLHIPGRHNILNALGVIAAGLRLDIPLITIKEALAEFQGTQRRFQLQRLPGDIWLVEDYAHHPAEIRATLAADAAEGRHRLVVFQPHRFSRTQSLEQEFSECFDRADGRNNRFLIYTGQANDSRS